MSIEKQASGAGQKWYVVYTRAKAEKKAWSELNGLGIEAYVPLQKVIRQWKDRKKKVEIPLITSYVFVKLNPAERDKVFACSHVVKYVSFEGKPVAIPEKQMLDMQCMVDSDIPIEAIQQDFRAGEHVQILYGPMTGVTGELVSIHREKKFLLRILNIGYSLVASIPAAWVTKVPSESR